MDHLLELFHSEHDEYILYFDLRMLQAWLVVSPPTKLYIHLLCCFIKTEEQMLQSQIACHTFLCMSQPKPLWNWLMETRDITKELGLFYVSFLPVWLHVQLDQFIIFQVTLPTLYHQVPSIFILVFKRLHKNLLNVVTLLTLKVVLGDHHTRITTILTTFNSKLSRSILTETRILFSQLPVDFPKKIYQLIHQLFGRVSITRLKIMAR